MDIIANILTLGFLQVLLGCGQTGGKSEPYNEKREIVPDPEGYKKDTFILDSKDTLSNAGCSYDKYLNEAKTPKLAKEIFYNKDRDLNNDNVLSFLDSLNAKDKNARPFYFRVVTNSKKKADGYYSEGLGLAGKEYVRNHTKEFLTYFDNKYCFTDRDLETWADIVLLEVGLADEKEYNNPLIDRYIDKLLLNCYDCSSNQKATLIKFTKLLKVKWTDYLKNVDQ